MNHTVSRVLPGAGRLGGGAPGTDWVPWALLAVGDEGRSLTLAWCRVEALDEGPGLSSTVCGRPSAMPPSTHRAPPGMTGRGARAEAVRVRCGAPGGARRH